jgi:hypothetical protein
MIKNYHNLMARWARSIFIFVLVLGMALIMLSNAFAADQALAEIREQANIKPSYNFSPLPANAGKGITVAIVSQGISQAMKGSLGSRVSVYSVLPGDSSPFEEDDTTIGSSIGTQLASLVGALAPQARIITIKALDSNGGGSYEDVQNGIRRATELGAKIIVLPIGAPGDHAGVASAIDAALKKGVLVVASASNNNSYGAGFPARLDGVVAVGATDAQDKVAPFSNYGGKIIYAPGVKITVAGRSDGISGTSHAAAVAGAIYAILWSQNPGMSRQRLVDAVTASAKGITARDGGSARLIDGQSALKALKRPAKGK